MVSERELVGNAENTSGLNTCKSILGSATNEN